MVVRDDHDRAALVGARAQQAQDHGAGLVVEVARRLVGEHDGRVVDERPRDREALLLAARELRGQRGGDHPQPEPVDQLAAALLGVRMRAAHPAREQHVRLPAQLGQQVEELEDEPDPPAAQRAQPALGGPVTRSPPTSMRPASGAVEPAEQVQQRRLARPRAAEHRDELAGCDLEVGAVQHAPRARPSPNVLTSPWALTAAII